MTFAGLYFISGIGFPSSRTCKGVVFLDCTWNFQKLSALEFMSLSVAEPIFNLYPYKTLINQSLAVTATSKELEDLLRPAM